MPIYEVYLRAVNTTPIRRQTWEVEWFRNSILPRKYRLNIPSEEKGDVDVSEFLSLLCSSHLDRTLTDYRKLPLINSLLISPLPPHPSPPFMGLTVNNRVYLIRSPLLACTEMKFQFFKEV